MSDRLRLPSAPRPPKLRRPPVFPRGPRLLTRTPLTQVGPSDAPPGFAGATTSNDEWPVYWALMRRLGEGQDPRTPPFFGAANGSFTYQSSELGGRKKIGGAVVDFEVRQGGGMLGIRVESERFHVFASSRKQEMDEESKYALSRYMRIVDLYSQDYITDKSGQQVMILVKNALAGIDEISPIRSGTAERTRA